MSEDKPGRLTYYVFDFTEPSIVHKPFFERCMELNSIALLRELPNVQFVQQKLVENYEELIDYEGKILERGFEGIMMRSPIAHYKMGRATWREGIIYKLKRFQDAEGMVLGLQEQQTNTNVLQTDELGYAKRSYEKAGMVPANTLGKFIVDFNGIELTVAPGQFNHAERKEIWDNQERYIGKYLKFRFMTYGMKDLPRFPRAVGFRDTMDIQ